MTTYDFVHLAFLALDGEIKGKTKLQKTIYFMGLVAGIEDELGYRPHYYGPYSPDVAAAVERLRTLGFLDQSVVGSGTADTRGFEVARYDYRLNEAGRGVAEQKRSSMPEVWERVTTAAKSMETLLKQDYMKMSIAAKTLFLLREREGHASMGDLAALAPRFGWSVTAEQVQEAAKLLQEAKLVVLN